MDKPVIAIRLTRCPPEREEQFNRWYDEVHVPLLLKSKWVDSATRYKLVPMGQDQAPPYLAIYGFKSQQAYQNHEASPEVSAVIRERYQTWGGPGYEVLLRAVYEPIRTWQK